MKKFIILFSILILCVYCSATTYKNDTEKSAEVQHLITEEDENKSLKPYLSKLVKVE